MSLGDMLDHAREAVELLGDAGLDALRRNRLAHGYDVIGIGLLWDTVTTDLPPLIESLKGIVKDD